MEFRLRKFGLSLIPFPRVGEGEASLPFFFMLAASGVHSVLGVTLAVDNVDVVSSDVVIISVVDTLVDVVVVSTVVVEGTVVVGFLVVVGGASPSGRFSPSEIKVLQFSIGWMMNSKTISILVRIFDTEPP